MEGIYIHTIITYYGLYVNTYGKALYRDHCVHVYISLCKAYSLLVAHKKKILHI